MKNRLNKNAKANYFRFNILIREKKTQIDNMKQIKNFRKYVYLQSNDQNNRLITIFALLTTSFFFELKTLLVLKIKHYICQKFIRCRNDSKSVFDFFTRFHDTRLEICIDALILRFLNYKNICNIYNLFRKRVFVFVRYLKNIIIINIKYISTRRKINEFSHNIL